VNNRPVNRINNTIVLKKTYSETSLKWKQG